MSAPELDSAGHIRRRGKRSWAIVVDIGYDAAGKRKQKWHSFKGTKKEAEAELAKQVNALNSGAYVGPGRLTVGSYLDQWLANIKSNISATTMQRYKSIVVQHLKPAFGNIVLTKLQPLQIQNCYSRWLESGRKDSWPHATCSSLSAPVAPGFSASTNPGARMAWS